MSEPSSEEDIRAQNREELLSLLGSLVGSESTEEAEALLQEVAPVTVKEDGRRVVRARASHPEKLPEAAFCAQREHAARVDAQFIAAERMERWAVRAVLWPLLGAGLLLLM